MELHRMPLELFWVPREQNIEADELSNEESRRFDAALEIKVDLGKLDFILLKEMLDKGEELYKLVEDRKASARVTDQRPQKRQRKPEHKLRSTHPW